MGKELLPLYIRWMIRRDMPDVMQIEEDFKYSWTDQDFLRCLRQRNCIGMVAEHKEKVVGYMIYELHSGYMYLERAAVNSSVYRQYVGTRMMKKLISKLSSHRRTMIEATVRETNLAAQLFLKSCGFKAESVERAWFKGDTMEDAYIMRYRLDDGNLPAELPLPEFDAGCSIMEEKEEEIPVQEKTENPIEQDLTIRCDET
jgi:ribosomal-protein-alanine N-acetyltransferase